MAKSAQERFNAYLAEYAETTDAVNEMVNASVANYKSYAHATGVLSTMLQDAISQLPRAQRADMRERLYRVAQDQKNDLVFKTVKA